MTTDHSASDATPGATPSATPGAMQQRTDLVAAQSVHIHQKIAHDLEPLLAPLLALVCNRAQPYAAQQEDGTYRWIYQPTDAAVLAAHLGGSATIALSSLGEDGSCRWVCLDADAADALPELLELAAALIERGLPALVEASRRGGHLWLLFDGPVPAALARRVVLQTLDALRAENVVPVPSLELYPDTAQRGVLGHAARLPLGIHRLTGKRYPLFDEEGSPCAFTSSAAAVQFLLDWPRVSPQQLMHIARTLPQASQHGHGDDGEAKGHEEHSWHGRRGKQTPTHTDDAARTPLQIGTRSAVIRWVDAHVAIPDLLAELAPMTDLQKVGRGYLGWCPFHDDRAPDEQGRLGTPSFYVVRDRRYGWSWRCYSTNCSHSVGPLRHSFRLLQDLLELTASQAIREACARWPEADAHRRLAAMPLAEVTVLDQDEDDSEQRQPSRRRRRKERAHDEALPD